MKNLIKLFMVMAVLCIVACSQTFEDVSNNAKTQEKAQGRLVMNVGNRSRTIMPIIAADDIKSATLTANNTEIGSWIGDNVIGQIESDNSILLDVGSYNFEMVFCNENSDVILIGTINNQEIKTGDNSLTFDMQISTTGKGNISIELSWEADNGISKIKAGLYNIATSEAVENYEPEELTISGTQSTYSKDNVPAGQYIIKFEVYDTSDKLLNTLTDVIKVLGGKTTTDQITLNKINTQYTITYNLDEGSWKSDFTPVEARNANTKITLPTAEDIEKTNYILVGWYDGNGDKITEIPSDTTGDITVTAGWGITSEAAISKIENLSGSETYDIVIGGMITSRTISTINTALQSNSSAKVNLDLSGTTGLTTINDFAFRYCSSLTSVTIPDSVTSIGDLAFYGCSSLESVTIPDSVTYISDSAFFWCTNLTNFNVSTNNASLSSSEDGKILYNKDKTTLIAYPSATGDVTIGNSVTTIGNNAFSYCSSLESVTIPDSVTSIGEGAFYNCSKLTSVTIPDSVTSIGGYAFEDCSNLESVTIPNSVTSIGDFAFWSCSSLESVTIPNSVTSIGKSTFKGCSNLESVTIGDSVTYISDSAFYGCSSLTSVTIGDSVTSIGEWAFKGCSNLESVTIPNSVTTIDRCTFEGCSSLESVTIPNSVTSIGASAFEGCSSLESVTIPDSVTYIGGLAFYGCSSLTSVTIPDSVTYISGAAFEGCSSLESVTIPDSVTSIDNWAFGYCSSLASVTIPDSVTTIGACAFYECSSLTSITIPDSVTYISDSAFFWCTNLTSVIIPDSVTYIDGAAFYECSSLESVTIPDSVTYIGACAFSGCSSLASVTIPDSVTSIDNWAFSYCSSLTSVTIPNCVTTIGNNAFYGCNSLTSMTFEDTSTWYYTENKDYTGGTVVDVTDTAQNAIYASTYKDKYWYKK